MFIKPASLKALLLMGLVIACMLPVNSSALIGIKTGDAPSEIILNDLSGNAVNVTSNFGNKPVILVFWELTLSNSFLNYSLDELKFLNDLYEKYSSDTGLEIFGIYTPEEENDIPDSELSEVKKLILTNKIKFPILIDTGFKYFREYGVIAMPSTIMVGKTGRIQFIYPSFPMAARPVISARVKELIGVEIPQKQEALKKEGYDAHAHRFYRYALQMYKRGLLEQAFSSLQKSIDIDPSYSPVHNLKGIILWKRGEFNVALEVFRQSIEIDRDNISAHLNYAIVLFEGGDFEGAERVLFEALTQPAGSEFQMRTHHLLGLIYKKTNRVDQAIKELEKALSYSKNSDHSMHKSTALTYSVKISILHTLSLIYGTQGNVEKSRDLAHMALHEAFHIKGTFIEEHLHQIDDLMTYE
jgi:Tfp pilus assembly protein PilF